MSKEEIEPKNIDWKEVAFELATIIDDFEIYYQMEKERERLSNSKIWEESPTDSFFVKRFIQFQKHFRRYKHILMHITEYEERKKRDDKRMTDLLTMTRKQT